MLTPPLPSRRRFLKSLSRTALVLSLEDVLSLVLPAQTPQQGSSRPTYDATPRAAPKAPSPVAGTPVGVSFTDVAKSSGLNARTIFGGEHKNRFLLETTGCGVAFFDFDHDDWLDIFLVNGSRLEGFAKGQEPLSHLFKNNRDGTFTDVTQKAGLTRAGWGQGCCVGDYDNDGWNDLFVSYYGQNALYRNNGNGTFTDVTVKAGLGQVGPRPRWGSGCAFLDFDKDGNLDLFVANYIDFDIKTAPLPEAAGCAYKGIQVAYGPPGLQGGKNLLYRNNGDGTFTDVSKKAGMLDTIGTYALSVQVADLDNDGWPDIYVANDSTAATYYQNQKDGTFKDVAIEAGVAYSPDGKPQAGMGVAVGDFNRDGLLDIVKTNFAGDTDSLYLNLGDGTFEDHTYLSGLGLNTRYLGWGVGFFDMDNDGWLDILISNGHVYPEVDGSHIDAPYAEHKYLYRNLRNGQFEEVTAKAGPGMNDPVAARGCAFGDYDNDGDVDVVVNCVNSLPQLLRCDTALPKNWIKIRTVGTKSNRTGIGAKITITSPVGGPNGLPLIQVDEVRSGGSYYSQNDLRLHFGLNTATKADSVEIAWPSGQVDRLKDLPANSLYVIQEGGKILKTMAMAGSVLRHKARAGTVTFSPLRARLVPLVLLFVIVARLPAQQHGPYPATTAHTGPAWFVDVAATAGILARNVNGDATTKRYIIEATGSGAAIIDYDRDGWPDIFLVNGRLLPTVSAPRSKDPEPSSHLFHNNRDGTFTDVTIKAGLNASGWGQGACVGDYDNDGFDDLYITQYGHNRLYHNEHNGTFQEVAEQAGLAGTGQEWGTGCAFVDFDRDGKLDLMVADYVHFDLSRTPVPGEAAGCMWKGTPVMCGPRGLESAPNILFHNLGNGRFADVSLSSGIRKTAGHYCFSVTTLDYDNDGWPDLYIACDSTPSILYRNNHNGTFTDTAADAGAAYNEDGREQAGMGSTAADFLGDGNLGLFKTNFSDDTSTLYKNNGDGTFTDITFSAGLGINADALGWGAMFADVDNDGLPDLLVVNGHVYPEVDSARLGASFREPRFLYSNLGKGKFRDISPTSGPGLQSPQSGRGLAIADLWNDGRLSAVVNNLSDLPMLLVNQAASTNHWLGLRLIGTSSNASAIGARVTLIGSKRRWVDEVRSGSSYNSSSDLRLHFGLGTESSLKAIEVRWPNGQTESFPAPPLDRIVTLVEGKGKPAA